MKSVRASLLALFLLSLGLVSGVMARAPRLVISKSVSFSSGTKVGRTDVKAFYLRNLDSTRVINVAVGLPASSNFALKGPDSLVLNPLQLDSVLIEFQPQVEGQLLDSLWISHDADTLFTKDPYRLRLSGLALSAADTSPKIALSATLLQFRTVVDSPVFRSLILRNTSDTARMLVGTLSALAAPFSYDTADTRFQLAWHDSAIFRIRFAPTVGGTTYLDSLFVSSNADSMFSHLRVYLSGSAQNQPQDTPKVSIDLSSVSIPAIANGSDTTISLIVTNISTSAATLTGNVSAPHAPFSLRNASRSFSLSTGASDTLMLEIHPTLTGRFSDSLVIVTNSDRPRTVIPLSATVIVPAEVNAAVQPFAVYPNPARSVLRVAVPGDPRSFELLDLEGRVVESGALQQDIDVTSLPNGCYLLRARTGSVLLERRVVVQH